MMLCFCGMQEVLPAFHHPAMAATRSLASVMHLSAKKGGLVISRHNEIRDELSDLASKALAPSAVCDEAKIHTCHNPEEKSDKGNQANSVKRLFRNNRNEDRGDILIRGLWSQSTDCIIDVRITLNRAKRKRGTRLIMGN
jgi:hypothetical protein